MRSRGVGVRAMTAGAPASRVRDDAAATIWVGRTSLSMEHSSLRRGSAQTAPATRYGLVDWSAAPPGEYVVLVVMVLALALFYRASPQLPMTALGLALFA